MMIFATMVVSTLFSITFPKRWSLAVTGAGNLAMLGQVVVVAVSLVLIATCIAVREPVPSRLATTTLFAVMVLAITFVLLPAH